MQKKILFVTHPQKNCGVHEYGVAVFEALRNSKIFEFIYFECSSLEQLNQAIREYQPAAIIYNYYPSTMPWLTKKIIHNHYRSLNKHINVPQIGIMHEVTQRKADAINADLFNFYVAPDPTLLLKNPIVFKTGRLIPVYTNNFAIPEIPTIGSFGFATPNKGFELIVEAVQREFDSAVIRFNIPPADFADKDGRKAQNLIARCRSLITKNGISLVATHNFLDKNAILDFLAQNTLNVFLYQDKTNRGLSSTLDYALAVARPVAISDSVMFRHLHNINPSIVYETSSLKSIWENGIQYQKVLKTEWNQENLIWEYERILITIFKAKPAPANNAVTPIGKIKNKILEWSGVYSKTFSWLRNTESVTEDDLKLVSNIRYTPVTFSNDERFNKILDNTQRQLYEPAIKMLWQLVPGTMNKKIAEANVQQAFVFDTVYRLAANKKLRILCIGSYEDTAAMSLKKMGFQIEEIDPVINYTLQEFYTKPTTCKNHYDIIFSTSVIEHDPDDESFMKCLESLLKKGGTAVLTCDYKDGWTPADPKPAVDERFYTMEDLSKRLPSYIPNCDILGKPDWGCEAPDFNYLGKFQYTFATFVFQKKESD